MTNKTLSRRDFLRMTGTAAAGAALGACKKSTQPSQEKVQLVYQDWRTEWFPVMAQNALQSFHDQHPNIRVFYTPDPEDVEQSLLKDMRSGAAPDVFASCCTWFPILAQDGQALDLRPFVEKDLDQEIIEDWDQAQYQAFFTRDGVQYGLPKYCGALALYYNKDLLDHYGVDYPDETWDHDDYLSAIKRLTHDRDDDGKTDLWGSMVDISWVRFQIYVNAWGGNLVNPDDPAHCLMCEPEAMQAMKWIHARMWDDKVMATFLDVQNVSTRQAFINEQIAMVEDGSWALKDILDGAKFRIGVSPRPAGPVRRVTLATTDGFGIYAGTKHPQEAWELLKFLVSKEYGRAMAQANFLQPARKSLVDEWANFIREEYPDKAADIDIAAFADGQVKGYSVTTEVFANMDEAKRLTYEAWEQIFTLGQQPLEHINSVCQQIQAAQP